MDLGQRLVLMIDYNNIDANTVVTLEAIINDDTGIVRYDYDELNESMFKGVPLSLLRPATQDEINQTSYKKITDKSFWIGSKWRTHIRISKSVDKGLDVTVIEVNPSLNSQRDFIKVIAEGIDPTVLYSSALKDYCIPINPDLEEALAEEISDSGSNLYIRPGERVLYNNQVVTIVESDEENCMLKVCYDMSNFSTIEIKASEVSNVNAEQLAETDYNKLLSGIHIGDQFKARMEIPLEEIDENISAGSISADGVVTVKSVKTLSHYALEDEFVVTYEDVDFELISYDLLSYFNKV